VREEMSENEARRRRMCERRWNNAARAHSEQTFHTMLTSFFKTWLKVMLRGRTNEFRNTFFTSWDDQDM